MKLQNTIFHRRRTHQESDPTSTIDSRFLSAGALCGVLPGRVRRAPGGHDQQVSPTRSPRFSTMRASAAALISLLAVSGLALAQGPAVLTASLDGGQEVPPTPSLATGVGTATFNPATSTVSITVQTTGLVGTAAHLHLAPQGVNGAIIVPLTGGPVAWNGSGTLTASQASAMLAGGTYLNVHSAAFPGGEIRGQVRPVYFGMQHEPLGQAQLSKDVSGNLVVANLGNSGNDGFRVNLVQSRGWGFTFLDPDPFTMPIGAFTQWTMKANINGVPNQTAWIERHEIVAFGGRNVRQISFDSSAIGATSNHIDIYYQDILVFSGDLPNGPLYKVDEGCCYFPPPPVRWDNTCVGCCPGTRIFAPIIPTGGPTVRQWDRIVHFPLNPTRRVAYCSAVEGRAAFVGLSTTIFDEVLIALPSLIAYRTLGQAVIDGRTDRAIIANIGSSGQDGVECALLTADSCHVDFDALDALGAIPMGATLLAKAYGTVSGTPDQPLGQLSVRKVATGFEVVPNFTAIGSLTHRVQVWSGATLVADFPGHTGIAATSSIGPIGLGKLGGATECFAPRFPNGTQFVINGTPFIGNELRVLAEGSGSRIESKSRFQITATQIPQLTIRAAGTTELIGRACPGTGGRLPGISDRGPATMPNPNYGLHLRAALANTAAVLLVDAASVGLALGGGCGLYVSPVVVLPAAVDGSGSATVNLPVPNAPNLLYLNLFFQYGVADPGGAFLGALSLTKGLRVRLGT